MIELNTGITFGLAFLMQSMLHGVLQPLRPTRSRFVFGFVAISDAIIWCWWLSGFVIQYPKYAGVRGWHPLVLES